jgi:hypothetical protein
MEDKVKMHGFHKDIGSIFQIYFENKKNEYKVILDHACDTNPNQNIPLFLEYEKSNSTEITNVDILITKNDKVVLICEIEASNVKPNHIFGKFLSVALSKYWSFNKNLPKELGNDINFIQVLSSKNLNEEKSKKFEQWKNIHNKINSEIINNGLFNCKSYKIIFNEKNDIGVIERNLIDILDKL